ncbi:hypothetical protein KBC75_03135 [Candidatus Shapirobacteria bacterium]|nr:hypothetical protein [Candidatus Shapirobacteria bacterium]
MEKILIKISRVVLVSTMLGVVFMGLVVEINRKNSNKIASDKTKPSVISAMNQDVAVNVGEVLGVDDATMIIKVTPADARPLLIKKYLEKYKSPLVPYSDLIFELSQTYGFDYYWIIAIGQQESNLCKKIPENSFNCWGYGINSAGTLRFESYDLALKSYAEYLKREYFDKGYNTPEKIMKKYCPHSNGSWAYGVQYFINEIESGNF